METCSSPKPELPIKTAAENEPSLALAIKSQNVQGSSMVERKSDNGLTLATGSFSPNSITSSISQKQRMALTSSTPSPLPASCDDSEYSDESNELNTSLLSTLDTNQPDSASQVSDNSSSAKNRSKESAYASISNLLVNSITAEEKATQARKKGPWTAAEDELLRTLVAKFGPRKWSIIALHVDGRIGKQCRERWMNHLDESLLKTSWSSEEDELLIKIQKSIGNRWSEMTKYFVGRSENSIKNRWYSVSKSYCKVSHKRLKEDIQQQLQDAPISVSNMVGTKSIEELVELARNQPKRQKVSSDDDDAIKASPESHSYGSKRSLISNDSSKDEPLSLPESAPEKFAKPQIQNSNQPERIHHIGMNAGIPAHNPFADAFYDQNSRNLWNGTKNFQPYPYYPGYIQHPYIQAHPMLANQFQPQFCYHPDMNFQGFGVPPTIPHFPPNQMPSTHPATGAALL